MYICAGIIISTSMKAILLVRVSSDSQEFEEQKCSLTEYAKQFGYKNKADRIIIENEESAIKLNIDERVGIIRTKEAIEGDKSINAVFVWELSRLVRNQTDGHLLKDYFFKNNIQFYCSQPEIQLFNDDITAPHETGDITYSLFLNLTESEMRTKKARFHRSKVRNAKHGKYSGGFKKYGYCVDDNGYYEIKESEAEMIRYIFDEYEKGRSTMNIQRELLQRGKINSTNFVRGILTSEAYTGESNEYGMNRKYPPIIDKEQYNRCREIARENNKKADKANEIYFAKKLIKCTECGTHYIAMKSSLTYLCYGRYGKEAKLKPETACKASPTININLLDSLLWRLAKFSEQYRTDMASIEEKNELQETVNAYKQHIQESSASLTKLNRKKERIADNYTEGVYTKEQRDEKFRTVDKQINETRNFIVRKRNEIKKIENLIKKEFKEYEGQELIDFLKREAALKAERLEEVDDDLEKQEIVQRNIREVNVLEDEANKSKILKIKYHRGKEQRYRVLIKKKPPIVELDLTYGDDDFPEVFAPINPPLETTKRFVRKSQSKKTKPNH